MWSFVWKCTSFPIAITKFKRNQLELLCKSNCSLTQQVMTKSYFKSKIRNTGNSLDICQSWSGGWCCCGDAASLHSLLLCSVLRVAWGTAWRNIFLSRAISSTTLECAVTIHDFYFSFFVIKDIKKNKEYYWIYNSVGWSGETCCLQWWLVRRVEGQSLRYKLYTVDQKSPDSDVKKESSYIVPEPFLLLF